MIVFDEARSLPEPDSPISRNENIVTNNSRSSSTTSSDRQRIDRTFPSSSSLQKEDEKNSLVLRKGGRREGRKKEGNKRLASTQGCGTGLKFRLSGRISLFLRFDISSIMLDQWRTVGLRLTREDASVEGSSVEKGRAKVHMFQSSKILDGSTAETEPGRKEFQ